MAISELFMAFSPKKISFSSKYFGFRPFMNEMRASLKPELPYLYSEQLVACALFGCSKIPGYIKLRCPALPHIALQHD